MNSDNELNDTARSASHLHRLHSPYDLLPPPPRLQPNHDVGPMGMSRDSLNGTIARTLHHESMNPDHELSDSPTGGITMLTQIVRDSKSEYASIQIQRWYRKKRTQRRRPNAVRMETGSSIHNEHRPPTPRKRPESPRSTRSSISVTRGRSTPVPSHLSPSHIHHVREH